MLEIVLRLKPMISLCVIRVLCTYSEDNFTIIVCILMAKHQEVSSTCGFRLCCYYFCFVFQEGLSLYSPACFGTCFVDQADIELKRSTFLCLPNTRIKGVCHHCPLEHLQIIDAQPMLWFGHLKHTICLKIHTCMCLCV